MNKNEELQKWLNDDRYVQAKELEIMWNVGRGGVGDFLRSRKIKNVKVFCHSQGSSAFYDKQQCVNARAIYNAKIQELQNWLNDTKFIQKQELALKWGFTVNTVSSFLYNRNIKSIKKIHNGGAGGYAFYDRAECERARPFINQPKKEVEKVENIGELATATKHQILSETGADNFVWDKVTMKHKIMPVKNYCDERGNFVSLFNKDESVSAILEYKNEQKQLLEKCLADKNLVTTTDLAKIWNTNKKSIYNKIYRLKIKPYAKVKLENGNIWHFYKKSDCIESQDVEKVEQNELPEIKPETAETMPDIIPADTIDLFTMSELESELNKRGVELTDEVKAKINASDMPEMQHIATMLSGNAKTIAIRLSALNEISGQLKKIDANNTLKTKVERVLHYASRKTSLTKHDACELNDLGYLTRNQALKMLSPFTTQERARQIFSKHILKAYLYGNNSYVVLWDKDVVERFIDDEESRLSIAETFTPISDCISEKTDNAIPTLSNENKLDTILSRLNEIEHQIVHHENFGPSEDIINHFKSAIQSRSNILSALMSRAKIVIHNESCVILLNQKFAVDKVSESIGKEMINNALMDIGCKDFNIYVLFSGKCDVKNNQEE